MPPHRGNLKARAPDTAARGLQWCKTEGLPRKGEHEADEPLPEVLPQKGECYPEAPSQKRKLECHPSKGEHELGWPPREPSDEVVLSTWGGRSGLHDPGARLPREHIIELKRPVEAKDITHLSIR
jgi:hypothetical protein